MNFCVNEKCNNNNPDKIDGCDLYMAGHLTACVDFKGRRVNIVKRYCGNTKVTKKTFNEDIMSQLKFPEPHIMKLLLACAELSQLDQSFDDFGDDYSADEFSGYSNVRNKLIDKIKTISQLSNGKPIKKKDMTCVGCKDVDTCGYVWDFYNTSGECLANK